MAFTLLSTGADGSNIKAEDAGSLGINIAPQVSSLFAPMATVVFKNFVFSMEHAVCELGHKGVHFLLELFAGCGIFGPSKLEGFRVELVGNMGEFGIRFSV